MKILFIELYYFPSIASTAQLLSQLCNRLVEDHPELELSVLASDLGYSGNEANLERGFKIDPRIQMKRINVPKADKNNLSLRLIAYLIYYLRATFFLMFQSRKYDTIVSLSNPPFISLMSGFWGKVYGKETIFWLMDMYPDALEAQNPGSKDGFVYKILDRLARKQYSLNKQIVSLSSCMEEKLLSKGVPAEKLSIVQNWADDSVFTATPEKSEDGLFSQFNDRFVLTYFGNMGIGHQFDSILGLAERFANHPLVSIVFVGGGHRKPEIEEWQAKHPMDNFHLYNYISPEQVPELLAVTHFSFISIREGFEAIIVPSKLYPSLAAGVPVILFSPQNNEIAKTIDTHEVGGSFMEGQIAEAFTFIEPFLIDQEKWQSLSSHTHKVYFDHYSLAKSSHRWAQLLRLSKQTITV